MHGLAGEIVRRIEPETESDPVALLADLLTTFGAVIGSGPHMSVDRTEHPARLFTLIIGDTARARKGTSRNNIARLFREAEPKWAESRVFSGLSTGEGLVEMVKDRSGEDGEVRPGDKRTLVVESEFARLLSVGGRDNNTLSALLRQGWDGGTLSVRTRNNPLTASDAHIAIIGHVTKADLARHLTSTEISNGFANRFLWVASRRSKVLPTGGDVTDADFADMAYPLCQVLDQAEEVKRMGWTQQGQRAWDAVYRSLGEDEHPNPAVDAILSRSEAQVLRLSLIYALLDGRKAVDAVHVRAASGLWNYCQASVLHVYDDNSTGHPKADRILAALKDSRANRLGRTAIMTKLFNGHIDKRELDEVIALLERLGLAHEEKVPTAGRPRRMVVLDED